MTLLPLDTFRAKLGLHPWHFWGVAGERVLPINAKCSGLTLEYSWQGTDAAGRDDVRQAIARAEQRLADYVGYAPAPRYVETAPIAWPRYFQTPLVRGRDRGGDGLRVAVQAPEGEVQAVGVEARTLVAQATVGGGTLVYHDAFGTGCADTFTITLPYTGSATPADIAVYVTAADRLDGAAVSERWRISPVSVAIGGGGTITIVGRRWLCVRPVRYEAPTGAPIDPTDASAFVTALDVMTRTTDASGATLATCPAVLIYETSDCGGWGRNYCACAPTPTTDPGTVGQVIARAVVRDRGLGLVVPAAAVYNAATGTWADASCGTCYAEPDRVVLRYCAGAAAGADGQMADAWAEIVTMLAAAELKTRIAACRETNARLFALQQDMALESTETERYAVAPGDLDNPFGTRRGQILAWRAARQRVLRRGMLA